MVHKAQLSLMASENAFDKLCETFIEDLTSESLQEYSISSVLRLHRALNNLKTGISEANQTKMLGGIEAYLMEEETQKKLTPMMWLSIADACSNGDNAELEDHARR